MKMFVLAAACLSILALSGCGNTARGLKQDGVQSSNALDNASRRIANANTN